MPVAGRSRECGHVAVGLKTGQTRPRDHSGTRRLKRRRRRWDRNRARRAADQWPRSELTVPPPEPPDPTQTAAGLAGFTVSAGELFHRQLSDEREAVIIPESLSYRLKRRLLGPPLVTERLNRPNASARSMALGVIAPDMISSTNYGTEEMLAILVPVMGVAAFTMLIPVTLAIIGVLFFVTLSYREVVTTYTKAGGSYVVSRDNFGTNVAQVAAAALIIDYVLTVAVQVAAGTDARDLGLPAADALHRADLRRRRRPHGLRQPPGSPGGGQDLRRPDLLLRDDDGSHGDDGPRQGCARQAPGAPHRPRLRLGPDRPSRGRPLDGSIGLHPAARVRERRLVAHRASRRCRTRSAPSARRKASTRGGCSS